MNWQFPSFKKQEPIDTQISSVLKRMQEVGVDHDEYPTLMGYLERLEKVKRASSKPKVSRDTIVMVVGNLVGIIAIVAYEQRGHVITSKGFSQIIRPKLS